MIKRKKRKYTKRAKSLSMKVQDFTGFEPREIPMSQKQFADLRFQCIQQAASYALVNGLDQSGLLEMANKLFNFCATGKIRQRKGK